MEGMTDTQEIIIKLVQSFLKETPLIVWGSGATIPYGLPSMQDLNQKLKGNIDGFNATNINLETELGKNKYKDKMPEIKQLIWNTIDEADRLVLEKIMSNNINEFNEIKLLIEKFMDNHPKNINIVTTNYDRVLEYIMSYYNFPYTDGFNGKTLSIFDEDEFKIKNIVNLVKVHGSLNWFDINDEIRFLPSALNKGISKIITPSKKKYQEAYSNPYRTLIQKADSLITKASSFLVIGFGFNDEHLTPKIHTRLKQGIPIVLITKAVSLSSLKELKDAEKYITFEEKESGKTKVTYKKNNTSQKQEIEFNGDLWRLNKFMEIL